MRNSVKLIHTVVAFVVLAIATIAPAAADKNATPGDVARFVAGLQPSEGSPLVALTKEQSWKLHSRHFNQAWKALDKRQLQPIAEFQKQFLPEHNDLMLYLFSGPDFLYANAFYPNADTYILTGLEPVGKIPSLTNLAPGTRSYALQALRSSMQTIVNISFFITKKMASQLRAGQLNGTLPVIYVFLARAGKKVARTELVTLNPDGTIVAQAKKRERGAAPGARITFTDPDGKVKTLYYFRTDLSNVGMKASGLSKFVESMGPSDSLVKSASYLLHSGNFVTARKLLHKVSDRVLQDDTGSPLRFYDKDLWGFRPFGYYLGPISIFAGNYQRDLKRLFLKEQRTPIKFGFGYKWRLNQSNVMLATKKTVQKSAATSETPAVDMAALATCRADCTSVYEPCRTTVEQRMEACIEKGETDACLKVWNQENTQCVSERLACTKKCK